MTNCKPWAIYARVSTEEQAEQGISLEAQEHACRALLTAHGLAFGGLYVDAGRSGKDLKRPEAQRLLADLEAGQLGGLTVYKLDRLTRRLRDLLDLVERFDSWGVGMMAVSDKIDTSGPMGRFFLTILGAIAQLEREQIGERTKLAMNALKVAGRSTGGAIPFGWRSVLRDGAKVQEPDPGTVEVVKSLYDRSLSGETLHALCRWMNESGHRTSRGSKWHQESVARLLRLDRNRGAVVSSATWSTVVERISEKKGKRGPGLKAKDVYTYLLAGVGRCGLCGGSLVCTSSTGKGGRYARYRCIRRSKGGKSVCAFPDLRADAAEGLVVATLAELATAKAGEVKRLYADHAARLQAEAAPASKQEAEMRGRVEALEGKRDALAMMLAEREVTPAQARPAFDKILGELAVV